MLEKDGSAGATLRRIPFLRIRMKSMTWASIAITGSMLLVAPVFAENWPQWRGPHFDGSSPETSLPEKLDPKTDAAWSTELPGPGAGTPVIWGDRVYLGALDRNTKKLYALCLNRANGTILWQKPVGLGALSNRMNDLASPSPITDGKTVWFYFGTGDLAAFDPEGNPLWARNIEKEHGKFNMLWLYSASPLLYGGKLYIPVLHRDTPVGPNGGAFSGTRADSYLLCLDPANGKDLWQVIRPTDAIAESREAYTTPIPVDVNGKTQIVVMGGDYLTGHDPETGAELWRFGSYNKDKSDTWRTVASACAGGGLVYCSPPKGGSRDASFYAVKPGGGDGANAQEAWKTGIITTDVCVPLYYQDRLFVLNGDRKSLMCLDPKTGQKQWTAELGGPHVYRASPTGADGKIYCINERGDVCVVSADGKILSKQSLGGEGTSRSSIAVAEGQVFVRTADRLYAFAKK
jgi:outer membrane protein assembly factor BamB